MNTIKGFITLLIIPVIGNGENSPASTFTHLLANSYVVSDV